jgi:hypothetical protein
MLNPKDAREQVTVWRWGRTLDVSEEKDAGSYAACYRFEIQTLGAEKQS